MCSATVVKPNSNQNPAIVPNKGTSNPIDNTKDMNIPIGKQNKPDDSNQSINQDGSNQSINQQMEKLELVLACTLALLKLESLENSKKPEPDQNIAKSPFSPGSPAPDSPDKTDSANNPSKTSKTANPDNANNPGVNNDKVIGKLVNLTLKALEEFDPSGEDDKNPSEPSPQPSSPPNNQKISYNSEYSYSG